MTTAEFRHIDTSKQPAGTKPWSKVDADGSSFTQTWVSRPVTDLRSLLANTSSTDNPPASSAAAGFSTDSAGFALLREPTAATEATFLDDAAVRGAYYAEVEALVRKYLPDGSTAAAPATNGSVNGSKVSKVVIFDHTIRRRTPDSARQPVQQVHVDQTPGAAAARVRRHVRDAAEAERLLAGRYQIVNVWRPIGRPASELPLAVIDWRSTRPDDFVAIDLLYPKRKEDKNDDDDDDDRGKEVKPDAATLQSTEGYEVRGETFGVRPSERHRYYYARDMRPDEVLLLKCYDSFGEGEAPLGRPGVAVRTPHTAFVDPLTPEGALPRQSIEVRCLVFYE
ncbi:hypothetical protein SLS62_002213 [Diatrype stigma]|uniref:Methyltransferase n=1 Tax=Diatrype stigma TaxID=117547 RepID=A0AAN9UYJ1_9PEZI